MSTVVVNPIVHRLFSVRLVFDILVKI